jgi:hypothetical protein
MSGNRTLGFLLEDATFYIHTSNEHEVARFGSTTSNANVRIYTDNQSNAGFIITAHRELNELYPSFSIQGSHLTFPSIYVQGSTGFLGINTNLPRAAVDIYGDFILDGQIIQTGSNQNIVSQVIQSGTLYTNAVYSCNIDGSIDFTNSTLSNVHQVVIKELQMEGLGMQRKEVAGVQFLVSTTGTHEIGYTLSWNGSGAYPYSELDMFEVSGMSYAAGSGTRMHHRFHCMVNPTNAPSQNLPGLDVVTEQNSMSGPGITQQPRVYVERVSFNSVKVFSRWTASSVHYHTSMKMDIFAPSSLGTINFIPYFL